MQLFHKDSAGQDWFWGIYSNNFEDREEEIFSWDSHLEYAQWFKETGVKLPVTVLHQPRFPVEVHLAQFIGLANGTFTAEEFTENYRKMYAPFAFAETEYILPVNGFMLVLAKILPGKENTVKLLKKLDWGMSHGYLTFDRDEKYYNQYRTFEFTSLPLALAANPVTLSSFQESKMDEMKAFSDEDREVIKQVLNADPEEVEQATQAAQEVLQKVLASKEVTTEEEVETEVTDEESTEEVAEETTEYEDIRAKIFVDLNVEELQQAFTKMAEMVQGVEERLNGFEDRIKQTERSDDEKVAAQFYVPNWDAWDKSVETDEEDVDVEALKEDAITEGESIKGVKGETDTDNPLVFGWLEPMGIGNQQ